MVVRGRLAPASESSAKKTSLLKSAELNQLGLHSLLPQAHLLGADGEGKRGASQWSGPQPWGAHFCTAASHEPKMRPTVLCFSSDPSIPAQPFQPHTEHRQFHTFPCHGICSARTFSGAIPRTMSCPRHPCPPAAIRNLLFP
jgi:hypothetical protein